MASDCTDKIYKIRPVYEMLTEQWREMYSLGEHIAIDEGMLKWRGRLSFRVYNKDKPTKYGIKAYILADSNSGYCWNMDIYHQQKKAIKETVEGLLTNRCTGLWHSLYMDNYYNSVELSEALLAQNIHTVGTLRCYRGEPPEIRNPQNIARHDVIARGNGKVMVLAWKDKRIVKAISTKHDSSVVSISRRKKGGHGAMEEVQKPVCICDYNQHMSGVDHVDQMISYYPCTRKTLKWTKKVFFYFMELSVTNAHVLYAARCGRSRRPMTLHEFHVKLVSKMCRKRLEHNDSSSSEEEDAPPTYQRTILQIGYGVVSNPTTYQLYLQQQTRNTPSESADYAVKTVFAAIHGSTVKTARLPSVIVRALAITIQRSICDSIRLANKYFPFIIFKTCVLC